MPLSMYQASVPVFRQMLANLAAILDKADAFATEKRVDPVRIARALDCIASVPAANVDGSESRAISLKIGSNQLELQGQSYLLGFALPSFSFHVTTACQSASNRRR